MFRLAVSRPATSVTRAIAAKTASSAVRSAGFATSTRITSAYATSSTHRRPVMSTPLRWYSSGGALAKDEIEGRIVSLLKGFDKVNDASKIVGTSHFANDLGLDSLDTVEVVMAIEEEFSIEIPDKDADTIHSVDKAVEYILNQPDAH